MDSTAACFFPALSTAFVAQGEMHGERGFELAPVHVDVIRFDDFCRTKGVPAARVVSAAWLLALRLYTGCDTPSFGVVAAEDAHLQRCSIDLGDGAMRVEDTIDSLRFHAVDDALKNFNTAVALAKAIPQVCVFFNF